MPNKFRNKNGDLTLYAFGCGYIQEEGDFLNGICTRLYKDGCFHIRTTGLKSETNQVWEVADTLTKARAEYKRQIREYHKR